MKNILIIATIALLMTSCGSGIEKEYIGTYTGSQPEHEMMINGKSYGIIPLQVYNPNFEW